MDQTARQHKQAAGEAEVDPLPADAGQRAAEQRLLQYLFHTVAAAQAGFETVERRGPLMPSTPICSSCSVAPCEVWPLKMASSVSWSDSAVARSSSGGSQLVICTGRDQQHHVTDHCRVERVLPEAAVQLLGDDDGEESTDDHPPGPAAAG